MVLACWAKKYILIYIILTLSTHRVSPSQFYTNNEITSNYKVGGLVFSSQGDFSILEDIDEEFETFILAEDTSIYFKLIGKIDITGTYPDAHQELLELFPNIFFTRLQR